MLDQPDPITVISLLIVCSIVLRQVLVFAGQHWVKTYAHTLTLVLLPLITYSITSIIAGNIALSLGMVGALSIVRFRNPVKSPFELVIFFLLITMGITAGVDAEVLLALTVVTALVLLGFKAMDVLTQKVLGRNFFQVSFSEGSELPTIEIESSKELAGYIERDELVSFIKEGDHYQYVFASREKVVLLTMAGDLENNKHVKRVRFSTY